MINRYLVAVFCFLVGLLAYFYTVQVNKPDAQRRSSSSENVDYRLTSKPDRMPKPRPSIRAARSRPRVPASPAARGRSHVHPRKTVRPSGFSALELRIAWCESKNSYTAQNPTSTASGRWQFLKSTWNRFMGYSEAYLAPPHIQDLKARQVLNAQGTRPWNASRHCWSR